MVVADDHPMVRATIALACRVHHRIEVVGQASTGPEAVDCCRELAADVLVLDLMLPELDGFEVAKELKRQRIGTKILVLTARDDQAAMFEAMRLSMDGYLDKTTDMESLTEAIVAVADGHRLFTAEQERQAFEAFGHVLRRTRDSSLTGLALTEREVEVLRCIAEGLSTKEIALKLGVSSSTIESHIYRLYRKLGVRSRVGAFARGEELGLVDRHRNRS